MKKTLGSLLILAAMSMPLFAQTAPPRPNSFLDQVFFPKLTRIDQVDDLVRQAGYTPQSDLFVATLPTCRMTIALAISDDGDNLVLLLPLGSLSNEQARNIDQLSSPLKELTPKQMKFPSQFITQRTNQDQVALALLVLIPNRGATPDDIKQAVSELAQTSMATEFIWNFWAKQ